MADEKASGTMASDSGPDDTRISSTTTLEESATNAPFLDRLTETVRRFEDRKKLEDVLYDRPPASFSVPRGTKSSGTSATTVAGRNAPVAVRKRLERLGLSSEAIANAIRDRPRSFAPISSNDAPRDTPSLALERILGRNDLIGVDFLESASKAARAIGRISVKNPARRLTGYGTGCMVAPRLFLTNNHVIETREIAAVSTVEFGFETDTDGRLRQGQSFRFAPDMFFLTDIVLDFTLVAIDPGEGGLDDFGWLPMVDFQDGSVLIGEFVNIVQHPNGQPKQLAIRDNQVIDVLPDFLHYRADTQPGSSGSPVFTDQWEMVALHHSGIPRSDANGRILTPDGQLWEKRMGDAAIDWIANEGVRIERILACLNDAKLPDTFRKFRDESLANRTEGKKIAGKGITGRNDRSSDAPTHPLGSIALVPKFDQGSWIVHPGPAQDGEVSFEIPLRITLSLGAVSNGAALDDSPVVRKNLQEAISIDPEYETRAGYDSKFLGSGKSVVPLPKMSAKLRSRAAVNSRARKEEDPAVFAYHHFSLIFEASRKLAICTAVNIDGSTRMALKRDDDKWIFDPRLPRNAQAGLELYETNEFDLGHLVRRLDPAWGKSEKQARLANDDTFHFTNCSPQHELFNRGKNLWAGLEDHLLNKAGAQKSRMTIFTGPIFRDDDPDYRNFRIPREYWKIAAYVKPEAGLVSAAFLVSQAKLIDPVVRSEGTKAASAAETFQTTVAEIERLTGLDFGRLRLGDVKRRPGVSFAPGQPGDRVPLEDFASIELA